MARTGVLKNLAQRYSNNTMKFSLKSSLALGLLANASSWKSVRSFAFIGGGHLQSLSSPSAAAEIKNTDKVFSLKATATDKDANEQIEITLPKLKGPTVELTEAEIELIARNLRETIDIPYLPNPIEKQVVKMALTSFCSIAPIALPEGLFEELVSGNEDWDNVKEEFIHVINDQICIPIVSRKVQDQIVDGICTVMFTSKSEKSAKRQFIGRALQTTLNQESDDKLASMLNGMIDIPLMSEDQEQQLFLKLAKSIHDAFQVLVPEPMRDVLTSTAPEDLQQARLNLINRLNEKIDIPFKTEEEEAVYFKSIVDFLLKRYGVNKGTKTPAEQIEDINKELDIVNLELDVQVDIYENKMKDLNDNKDSLTKKLSELQELL